MASFTSPASATAADDTPALKPVSGSIMSLRIRNQLTIGVALTIVIPALAMGYLVLSRWAETRSLDVSAVWIALCVVTCICLGFYVLARHAINLTRLRQSLEDLLEGEVRGPVKLLPGTTDVSAIESTLSMLRRHMVERMERELAEQQMQKAQEEMEKTIRDRTRRLEEVNENLQREIEERSRAEGLKDEFVSTVSHELRTPLAITKEGVNLLIDEIPGSLNDKQKKILTTAGANIDRLSRIINDLLDISKIEAGKLDLDKDRTDLSAIVNEVLAPMKPVAEKKGVILRGECDAGVEAVYADKDRIMQVLTNLVGNAMKFTDEGDIVVRTRQEDDSVVCSVEDSGIGLGSGELEGVFEKFTQFGRTHGAGIKGTGLGLAITKQIVELHRGKIWVESKENVGSKFIFSIPVYHEEAVIREAITRTIEQARHEQEDFLLLLFEMNPGGDGDPDAFAAGMRRLLDSQEHVRSTDLMIPRGDRQVILLASIRPDQLGLLYRRWESQVSACFLDVGALDVRLSCGYAEYPDDGPGADDLMRKALETMSDMGQIGQTETR